MKYEDSLQTQSKTKLTLPVSSRNAKRFIPKVENSKRIIKKYKIAFFFHFACVRAPSLFEGCLHCWLQKL